MSLADCGKSRMCPMQDSTMKSLPRNFRIVWPSSGIPRSPVFYLPQLWTYPHSLLLDPKYAIGFYNFLCSQLTQRPKDQVCFEEGIRYFSMMKSLHELPKTKIRFAFTDIDD